LEKMRGKIQEKIGKVTKTHLKEPAVLITRE